MPSNWCIYALVDPAQPNRIRYVGKTLLGATARLRAHVKEARIGRHRVWKNFWVAKLLREGRTPRAIVLESFYRPSRELMSRRERHWIAWLASTGHQLTNMTPGGDGGGVRGAKRSARCCARISRALRGKKHTLERRQAASRRNRGRRFSPRTEFKSGRRCPKDAGYRRKVSAGMSRLWRDRRKCGFKFRLSAEGRQRIIDAAHRRWSRQREEKV
jgi:hypothetical protein